MNVKQEKTADRARSEEAEVDQAVCDWGFSSWRSGMATETKIGLALCVLLVGAFAFVVYSKMNRQNQEPGAADQLVAGTDDSGGDEDATDTSTNPKSDGADLSGPAADDSQDAFAAQQQSADDDAFGIPQSEPQTGQFADSAQQSDPWAQQSERANSPKVGAVARNEIRQSAQQAEPFDPFAPTSPNDSTTAASQSSPPRTFADDDGFGREDDGVDDFHSARQSDSSTDDMAGAAHTLEQQAAHDLTRQAPEADDFFDPHQLAGEFSQQQQPSGQQAGDVDEFDPFADPDEETTTEQTAHAAAQQAAGPTDRAEFVEQQEIPEDAWQQGESGPATAQTAPLRDVDEFDEAPFDEFDVERSGGASTAQTQVDETVDVTRSSEAEPVGQSDWTQQSAAIGTRGPTQQTTPASHDLAEEFDPFAPEEQTEPRAFSRNRGVTEQRTFAEQRQFAEQRDFTGRQEKQHELTQQRPFDERNEHTEQSLNDDSPQARFGVAQRLESGFAKSSAIGEPAARPAVYEVVSGDNFWNISRKQYGAGRYYKALAAYNRQRIPDPQKMRPGMKVLIPDTHTLEAQFPDLLPRSGRVHPAGGAAEWSGFFTTPQGEPRYRVGPEDTLTEIARSHLGRSSRWVQIYALNRDRVSDPGRLKIGTVLRLPADASQVQLTGSRRGFQ